MRTKKIINVFVSFLMAFILVSGILSNDSMVYAASPKLNRKSATLQVGDTLQLKLKNTRKKVRWTSDKKSVATVSSKGKVKAKKPGKAVIKAKCNKKTYSCKINVLSSQKKKIELSASTLVIEYGKSAPLTLENADKKVAWFSSDTRIVYADGEKVYAKSVGEAVITAKYNGESYVCNVKVVSGETEKLVEGGIYTSKDKVAKYIKTYGRLPDNYITKEQARELGWEGGSLLSYAPYKCIGGDNYSNYEKTLPVKTGRKYYECDINTLGALKRGAERLVYSNDGLIYYTSDHYATFVKLYE